MNTPCRCLALLLVAGAPCAPAGDVDLPRWAVPTASGVTVPGLPEVTGRIAIDQFGYLPDERKVAVIGDPQEGYNAAETYEPGADLELRSAADGSVVFHGGPQLFDEGRTDAASGDRGWRFDFSAVREVGDYYVYDPKNARRSHVFRIAPDVYQPVLRAAMRVFFYQREAYPHRPPFAEEPWVDDATYLQDRRTRSITAKQDPRTERDLSGGWMDAGDTNKYPTFLPEVIHPLLYAWRGHPEAFGDDFGLPESGNNLPDLLDEVKWELDWLLKMQDADGGVFLKMGHDDYAGATWPLSADHRPRYYGPKVSSSTLAAAGVLAHAARVYQQFPVWHGYAEQLREHALQAWAWYRAHPRTYNADHGEIKSGDADKDAVGHDRLEAIAAVHLWALTKDSEYLDVLRTRFMSLRQMSEAVWSPYEAGQAESLLDYTRLPDADPAIARQILDQLASSTRAPEFLPPETADLYRAWMVPTAYHWGSNIICAGYGKVAVDALTYGRGEMDRVRLRQRGLDMLHALHGVNPVGLVYLSNMSRAGAEWSARRLYHDWFMPGTPVAENPAPGYVTGGPNRQYGGTLAWLKNQPPAKCYADFNTGYPENSWEITEPGIYYQAVYVRLLANFVRTGKH